MKKVKLENLFSALGLTDAQIAMELEKISGKPFPRRLISNAIEGVPIPALRAKILCEWLSQEFGHPIQPEDISDLKIHTFSTLPDPADTKEESIAFRKEKTDGFVAGFNLAYAARSKDRTLSHKEIHELAEQVTARRLNVFQESAGGVAPMRNVDAYRNACAFAAICLETIFSRPGGDKKYAEWKNCLPAQREQYARSMAHDFMQYL